MVLKEYYELQFPRHALFLLQLPASLSAQNGCCPADEQLFGILVYPHGQYGTWSFIYCLLSKLSSKGEAYFPTRVVTPVPRSDTRINEFSIVEGRGKDYFHVLDLELNRAHLKRPLILDTRFAKPETLFLFHLQQTCDAIEL